MQSQMHSVACVQTTVTSECCVKRVICKPWTGALAYMFGFILFVTIHLVHYSELVG